MIVNSCYFDVCGGKMIMCWEHQWSWCFVSFFYVGRHSFFSLGEFSFMILLKIFPCPSSWYSLDLFIPIIHKKTFFKVSQITWILWVRNCFRFNIFFCYIIYAWDHLFHYFCSVGCASVSVVLLRFSISKVPWVCIFFTASFTICRYWIVLFIFFTCLILFPVYLRDLLISPFKGLYHLHKTGFKDILLCFDCVRISRACYSRIPGLWICHIDLVLFDCVLMLAFSQLVIPGSFCHRRPDRKSVV